LFVENEMRMNKNNTMSLSALKELLSQSKSKEAIVFIAHACGNNGSPLLKLSLHENTNIAAKASWAFRRWAEDHTNEAMKMAGKMIEVLEFSDLDPVLRNILGTVYDNGFPDKFETVFTDICLRLIQQRHRAVAVHCNALGILTVLSKKHPELKYEVEMVLERSQIEATAAFNAQLKKFKKIHVPQ